MVKLIKSSTTSISQSETPVTHKSKSKPSFKPDLIVTPPHTNKKKRNNTHYQNPEEKEADDDEVRNIVITTIKKKRTEERPKIKPPKVEDKVNLVSVSYYSSEASNCVTIESLVWPSVHLYLPFSNNCHTCHEVHQWFHKVCYHDHSRQLYNISLEELLQMGYVPLYKKEEKEEGEEKEEVVVQVETLERHSHALVINENYMISLCAESLPRKPRNNPKSDPEQEQEQEQENDPDSITTEKKAVVARCPSWTINTMKQIRSIFYVETTKGKVISAGGTEPFEAYDFQIKFCDHVIKTYDWKDKTITHDLPFLLWHTVGLGKTLTALYAMQQSVPDTVTIVCDNALIKTRWCEEMFKYLPARFGNIVYNVIGYTEFRRRTQEEPEQFYQDVIIVDESQEYRTLTPGMMYDLGCFRQCRMLFNLTGTPFINQLEDLFGLNVQMEVVDLHEMKWFRKMQESFHIMKEDDLDEEILTKNTAVDDLDQLQSKTTQKKTTKKVQLSPKVPFEYINNSVNSEFRQWLIKKYKGRVFYMEPSVPIETTRVDVPIPMTWRQSFAYLMNMQQNMLMTMESARRFHKQHRGKHYKEDEFKDLIDDDPEDYEPINLSSAVHNAYDSMVRSICNCLYDRNQKTKVLDAVKFYWYLRLLEQKWVKHTEESEASIFPTVGYSNFLDCGVVGFHRLWVEYIAQLKKNDPQSPLLKIRLEIIKGNTTEKERIRLISDFNHQKIDVLLISKVGGRGLNLIGCKSITLFEVPMAPGEEEQIIGRICRAGNKSKANQHELPLLVLRLISMFPTNRPNEEESQLIRQEIYERSRGHDIPHIIDIVYRYVRSVGQTVDQKCAARNDLKTKQFAFLKDVLRECSI